MKIPWKWEELDEETLRVKVIGGWLILAREAVAHDMSADGRGLVAGWDFRPALAFVPDPKHEWEIDHDRE